MDNLNKVINDISRATVDSGGGEYPFLIFHIENLFLAINCKYVVTIEKKGKITEMAASVQTANVKGISYYKNEAINIIDFRSVLGFMSQIENLETNIDLQTRMNEHRNYMAEMERCVQEKRRFPLTNDPHKCNLGKWYYNYKTNNVTLKNILSRIEEPHERFHKSVDMVNYYIDREKYDVAEEEVNKIKATRFNEVISLLEELDATIRESIQDLVVVLKIGDKKTGLLVDKIENVEEIKEIQLLPPAVRVSEFIKKLGMRNKDNQIVLLLEPDAFK